VKRALIAFALVLTLAAGLFWLGAGANRGWTKTLVPIVTVDEVTGIEGITYQKKLVPGLDFLGISFATAAVLAAASLWIRNKRTTANTPLNP
jgi:hypothetical protein